MKYPEAPRAVSRLRPRFLVLSLGSVTLDVLLDEVDHWLEQQRKS